MVGRLLWLRSIRTLRQAFLNVLHNAIRYTQPGGHIKVLLAATNDGQAIIDMIDDGPGIPEAERTKVFERFYRVDEARSSVEGDAGLGLAIARLSKKMTSELYQDSESKAGGELPSFR